MSFMVQLTVLLGTVLALVYAFFRRQFAYWKERNVPFEPPTFPFGNLGVARSKTLGVALKHFYDKTKREPFYGLWFVQKPTLLVNDPELIKDILVKNFMNFHDHGIYHDEKADPLSAHLFSIEGSHWKNIRTKLTPTFTSGKMKMMFPIMMKCGEQLQEVLREPAEGGEVIEMKDLMARFSTDVISSCAFGIETNSLKNPDAIFRVMGRKIFEPRWGVILRNYLSIMAPNIARLIKMRITSKELGDFFTGVLRETISYREEKGVKRNDFLYLLIQLMTKGHVDDVDTQDHGTLDKQKFTFEQAVAQTFLFFLGGFETTSGTLQFTLYELALNQDLQEKLRTEIQETSIRSDGEMSYESLHSMEYMGRVLEESLRKYPSVPFLQRTCTKPYKIPGTEITLEKDTLVMISNLGLQMDEKYFPEPNKFDPDRFRDSAKATRNNYVYLPFGDGPRGCLGVRFAMMQMRVALTTILSNYRISIAEGQTPIPLELDHRVVVLTSKGGMPLRVSRV